MVAVPAFVWRGGFGYRALLTGAAAGTFLGALAWLDSGMWLSGLAVLVILGVALGIVTARRVDRYWPGSRALAGADRVAVVAAARAGRPVADERLRPAVADYGRGLRAAADSLRRARWVLWLVLAVALGMALWDSAFGSWRNLVASAVYLALMLCEMFWWPRWRDRLLANADRAAG